MFSTYILQSLKSKRYYIGMTSDMQKRFKDHNAGRNTSTKNSRPWKMIHEEKYQTKQEAWLRERQIKKYKHGEAFKMLIL